MTDPWGIQQLQNAPSPGMTFPFLANSCWETFWDEDCTCIIVFNSYQWPQPLGICQISFWNSWCFWLPKHTMAMGSTALLYAVRFGLGWQFLWASLVGGFSEFTSNHSPPSQARFYTSLTDLHSQHMGPWGLREESPEGFWAQREVGATGFAQQRSTAGQLPLAED